MVNVSMPDALAADAQSGKSGTWTVADALLIGISGTLVGLLLTVLFSEALRRYSSYVWSGIDRPMASALLSQLGTVLLITPVVLRIIKRRHLGGWCRSIEWNAGRCTLASFPAGAALAVSSSFVLTAVYGRPLSWGSETYVAVRLFLFILTNVLAAAFLEEVYYRGVLFVALAGRLGGATSIALVTVISAAMHPGHRLEVLPVMILLGIWRLRTKSVAACFTLHASYNLSLALYDVFVGR